MFDISLFLEKFKKIANSDVALKEKIQEVVFKKTKITLVPKDISLKNGIIHIEKSPLVKNMLFIQKQSILQELTSLGFKIQDIR